MASQQSPLSNFHDMVAALVGDILVHPTIEFVKTKGITIDINEFMNHLNLPRKVNPTVNVSSPYLVQPPVSGVPMGPLSGVAAPVVSKNKVATGTGTGEGCTYMFKRGANKGSYCPNTRFGNSVLCRSHTNKLLGKTAAGPVSVAPGFQGYQQPGASVGAVPGPFPGQGVVQAQVQETTRELTAVPMGQTPTGESIYKDAVHGFMFVDVNGSYVVGGKYLDDGVTVRDLTEQEKTTAVSIGLILGTPKVAPPVVTQTPATTQMPMPTPTPTTVAAPLAAPVQHAPSDNVPHIPIIPQIQGMGSMNN